MTALASRARRTWRFEPCQECGTKVRVVCQSDDKLCEERGLKCSDCELLPPLCQDCAKRALVFAMLALVFLVGIAFGCVAYAGFCR